jgi:hypothetical protein
MYFIPHPVPLTTLALCPARFTQLIGCTPGAEEPARGRFYSIEL